METVNQHFPQITNFIDLLTSSNCSIDHQLNQFVCSTEWVGDLDSETGGRIGLWKVCERNEMSDNCAGRLEDIMEVPSMSFQVKNIDKLCEKLF